MKQEIWTVARFPDGSWTTGGKPDDPDYNGCRVYQVFAASREQALRKAQRIRSREVKLTRQMNEAKLKLIREAV